MHLHPSLWNGYFEPHEGLLKVADLTGNVHYLNGPRFEHKATRLARFCSELQIVSPRNSAKRPIIAFFCTLPWS
jgi:hypothetical protein